MTLRVKLGAIHDGVRHEYLLWAPAPPHWAGYGLEAGDTVMEAQKVIAAEIEESESEGRDFCAFGYNGDPADIVEVGVCVAGG